MRKHAPTRLPQRGTHRCEPAHAAQTVRLLLQHAYGFAGSLHGPWLSVRMAPRLVVSPVEAGNACASRICDRIIIVHVCGPLGGRPRQCSCPSSSSGSQRVVFSTGDENVSSKASSMKSHPALVSAARAGSDSVPAFMLL